MVGLTVVGLTVVGSTVVGLTVVGLTVVGLTVVGLRLRPVRQLFQFRELADTERQLLVDWLRICSVR